MISRRKILSQSLMAAPALVLRPVTTWAYDGPLSKMDELEQRHGGRLGVAILNTANGKTFSYRGDERFPLCSTFKCLAAAFILFRVDRGLENLSRRIIYKQSDMVTYSPTTEKHVSDGMTLRAICEAAVTLSDNTAGNLMLDSFGGPTSLTAHLRSLGDSVTRLDRREPELNEALSNDPRDTTTPNAMAASVRRYTIGDVLSAESRQQLIAWLVANKTGGKRLRAGVPADWRVGDKTGSGNRNATNDVAVMWSPGRAAIVVTSYYVGASGTDDERSAVLADVGRIAASIERTPT